MRKICFVTFFVLMLKFYLNSQTLTFSHSGGFYNNSFNLELTCDGAYHIRYTTNGGTPTASSTLYEEPLFLDESLYSKSNIYTIVNCIPYTYYTVDDVERCIVIRAAVFDDNDSCVSEIKTNSYFINTLGIDLHNLPVISIAADSLALFDYNTGIFVPGASYDSSDSLQTGNYCMRGREWERLINLEFYETDNTGINQQCGMRTHGNKSRRLQQKGLKLYAREEYGKKRFKHDFFDDTDLNDVKHLCLRPFRCSNWLQTGAQDYIANRVAANLDIDAMSVREAVLFINGEYWGIYTLEESPDERYLEDHYNVDLEQVNLVKYWEVPTYGDPSDWYQFYDWIRTADLTLPEDSLVAFSRIDMHSFIDYMIFQIYSANLDWPQNNVRIWQPSTGEPFRLIFFDGDGCFSRWYYNAMNNATHQGGNSIVFNHFLENATFRHMFYNRYLELKDTHLSYDAIKQYIDYYRDNIEGEVEKQSQRFGFPYSYAKWEHDIDTNYVFASRRPEQFEQELLGFLSIDDVALEYFSCYPNPSNGRFMLNVGSRSETGVQLNIFNSMGQKVYSQKHDLTEGDNAICLNLDLPPCMYILEIGNKKQKIIIQQ